MGDKLKEDILEYFKNLVFNEEKHTYTVGKKYLPSVSKKIKSYYKPFDSSISKYVAKKEGISQEQVLQKWEDKKNKACDFGHKVHIFGELYPFDRTLTPSNKHEEAIVKFWQEMPDHIIPVTMELRMYHKIYHYAGTADILLYDLMNKCFIIADYKTNEDLFKNYKKQKMLEPFNMLLDCPFSKYELQLSYYQILLEQLDVKISRRIIVWLLPDGQYNMYDTNDFTSILKNELKS